MWRPLYYAPDGSSQTVDQALSVANPPVWSNGDKTMSITLKPWKWSNGQTVSSKDLQFTIHEIQAAVKASPANWASYVPGFFPDTITSMSTPNASTLVVNMKSAVNPTWMEEDILGSIQLFPSAEWAKDSASGPTLDFTNPANAAKIYSYLSAQSKAVNTYATNPLWQTVYGPYKLSAYNATTGAFTMVPNPTYSGPHASPQSTFVGVPFTSNAAMFNAIKSGSIDVSVVPPEDAPQLPSLKGIGYNYYGMPAWVTTSWPGTSRTRPATSTTSSRSCTSGRQCSTWRTRMARSRPSSTVTACRATGRSRCTRRARTCRPPRRPTPTRSASPPRRACSRRMAGTSSLAGPTPARPQGRRRGIAGPGIPVGTKLSFNLIYNTVSPYTQEVEDLASNAKAAGIQISLQGSNFNYIIQNYNDIASPANADKWAAEDFGGESLSTYPPRTGG